MHHAQLDKLSYQDSCIHRLDSRTKLIGVIVFTVCVISAGPRSVSVLFCYAVWPVAILTLASVPMRFVLRQILIASPFVAVLAISGLFFDRTLLPVAFGPFNWEITGGTLRCLSILGKFIITMGALMSLVATSRFGDLLSGLSRLGVPQPLVTQLGFLYRYIFLLVNRAEHVLCARTGRKLRNLGFVREMRVAAAMVGNLFAGSIDTAERIARAMQGRGFNGYFRTSSHTRFTWSDVVFAAALVCYLILIHLIAGGF